MSSSAASSSASDAPAPVQTLALKGVFMLEILQLVQLVVSVLVALVSMVLAVRRDRHTPGR